MKAAVAGTAAHAGGKRRARWLFLLAVPLFAIVMAHLHANRSEATVLTVERGDITQTVVTTGHVIAPSVVRLGTTLTGRARRVTTVAGQHVQAGDLLLELDADDIDAEVAEAEARVAMERARLFQLSSRELGLAERQLESADVELASAEKADGRTRTLVDAGAVPRTEGEQTSAALSLARALRDSARLRLADLGRAGGSTRIATAAVVEALAAVATARSRRPRSQVVAPADGTVASRHVEPGDIVQAGTTTFELVGDGPPRISIEPDERALGLVQIGQRARVTADAFPGEPFDARVTWRAPSVDVTTGTIEVRLSVDHPPTFLTIGMTVSVTVVAGQHNGVVAVPSEVVRDLETSPWVMVRDGEAQARRDLKLGVRDLRHVEILEGLAGGEHVVVPENAATAHKSVHPGC